MRKLMWFTLGFGAACTVGAYFYVSWLLWVAGGALLLAAMLWVATRWWRGFRIGVAILLGMAIGFGWFVCYNSAYLAPARYADGEKQSVTIQVDDYSYRTGYGCAFDGTVELLGRSYRVRAYLNTYETLSPGDFVAGTFYLCMSKSDTEPNQYPGKGIYLLVYQDSDILIETGESSVLDYPAVWRQKLKEIINEVFPADTAGFARALLLGDRSGIDYETNTAFKVSGISHVIAVSGLHVSILFGLIYTLSGRRRLLTALLGIPAVVIFAAVAGFSPSVVRAGIMQILVLIAMLFDKDYDQLTSLSFAALVMLAVNPMVITSVSFQLSVGCMLGIFLFSQKIRSRLSTKRRLGKWKRRLVNWFSGSISISLSAMVFTVPLVAIYFGTVSLVGVLTNLLVLWAVTYIFYGILLVCVAFFACLPVASGIAWCISWLVRYVLLICSFLSKLPLAAVYTKSIYIWLWLCFVYVLLFLYLILRKRSAVVFGCACVMGLCICLGLSWAEPLLDSCRVTALDVGQGQCILLQSEGKNFIVDCGGSYAEATADVAAETLLSQGISRVDGIVATHYDADHVGGMENLLTRIKADVIYLPYTQDEDGVGESIARIAPESVLFVSEDMELTFGNGKLRIFAPISYEFGNESSMCVLFQREKCAILITGDRSVQTEAILLQRYNIPKLDVLIAGHHGAKTSTGEQLLAQTMPEYVIISAGQNNRYGHPSDEVLQRLAKYNCKVLRTDQMGTVTIRR